MTPVRMSNLRALLIAMLLTLAIFSSNTTLQAKDPPSDACALLPSGQLTKVLGQTFGPPAKTTAPAAFRDSPTGMDCAYQTENGISHNLLFRIYVETSPEVAKVTFNKLSKFYEPNRTVVGNWDTAYLDASHAIHVQKGKVRYYLNLDPIGTDTAKTEKQLKDLATWVAGQL